MTPPDDPPPTHGSPHPDNTTTERSNVTSIAEFLSARGRSLPHVSPQADHPGDTEHTPHHSPMESPLRYLRPPPGTAAEASRTPLATPTAVSRYLDTLTTTAGSNGTLRVPTLRASTSACLTLGATPQDLDSVTHDAIAFTRWRRNRFGKRDTAFATAQWTYLRRDEGRHPHAPARDTRPATEAERAAVRWALARFAYLLHTDVEHDDACHEATTIPLEATAAPSAPRWPWTHPLNGNDPAPIERDNVVAGTIPVRAENATQYHSQRLLARRLLTVDKTNCLHDGWLTVPTEAAQRFGWTTVSPPLIHD